MRFLLLVSAMLIPPAALATTAILVVKPDGTGDYPTIQAAIDNAAGGDVIELPDGNRDLSFQGKSITIRSQSGYPETCIIDCQASASDCHRGFIFQCQEGPDSSLEDLTIVNGYMEDDYPAWDGCGGAVLMLDSTSPLMDNVIIRDCTAMSGGEIFLFNASPRLSGCSFLKNSVWYGVGGGINCTLSDPTIEDCLFSGNSAHQGGGGMGCNGGFPTLTRCWFTENSSHSYSNALDMWGSSGHADVIDCTFCANPFAGLMCVSGGSATLNGCTFVGNGRGIRIEDGSVLLHNTIIAFSTSAEAIEFWGAGGDALLARCDLYGNAGGDWTDRIADQLGLNGNIQLDHRFCLMTDEDFTLYASSPCAPFTPPNPYCDRIGAWPVECDEAAVSENLPGAPPAGTPCTWSGIKRRFDR